MPIHAYLLIAAALLAIILALVTSVFGVIEYAQ